MTLLQEGSPQAAHLEPQEPAAGQLDLHRIERTLLEEFGARVGRATVAAVFRSAVASFDSAPVRLYVPLLSERAARRRIRQLLAQPQADQTGVAAAG